MGISWQTLRQGCQNCFPGVHGNKLSRKIFRWKPYILLIRHWAECFHFFRKLYDWVARTVFHLAKGSFWEEVSAVIPPHHFRTLGKYFSGFCRIFILWVVQTAFLVSRRKLWVKEILQKSCRALFITFGLSHKENLAFWQKHSPGLSKAHSNWPLEQFEERSSLINFFGPF